MTSQSALYPSGAVFTVALERNGGKPLEEIPPGRKPSGLGAESFDLAIVEFNDDGSLVDAQQKSEAVDCIRAARASNPNGALVVVFIHGWHHSAQPADDHFSEFRRILMSLVLREGERPGSRRVVGVYLGWQGDPASWRGPWRETWRTHLSFFDRYRTAKGIGDGAALRTTIREIVDCTKSSLPPQPESPLALLGHSMGALMLESAFKALLDEGDTLIQKPAPGPKSCVQVECAGKLVSFPDVVIALNSAADSRITKAIITELEKRKLSKSASSDGISYSPPLFVSATSKQDRVTKLIWRLPFNFFRKTGGHDKTLFTHTLVLSATNVKCKRKTDVRDFGQNWSCLRPPKPPGVFSPTIPIDFPEQKRTPECDNPKFNRYQLTPRPGHEKANLAWIFQLPPSISAEHNDIFNFRSSLLILALMQISGAVMSLAKDWKDNFEPIT